MIALILGEHSLGGVGVLALVQRRDERRPSAQHRGDRQHGAEAPEDGAVKEHLAHPDVDRQRRQVLAQAREVLLFVERANLSQRLNRRLDRVLLGGLQRLAEETGDAPGHSLELDLEAEALQGHALDLRHGVLVENLVVHLSGVHPEASTRPDPPRSTPPLFRAGSGHPPLEKELHAGVRIVPVLLALAAVHDVHDVVDGDGSLGDVRGDDDFASVARRVLENRPLLRRAQRAVQAYEVFAVTGGCANGGVRAEAFVQLGNLREAGHEHQNRAGFHRSTHVLHEPRHEIVVNHGLVNRPQRVAHRREVPATAQCRDELGLARGVWTMRGTRRFVPVSFVPVCPRVAL